MISPFIYGTKYDTLDLNVVFDASSQSYVICSGSTPIATLASNGAMIVAGADGTLCYLTLESAE